MSFASKNETEKLTYNPQSDSKGTLCIHNTVRKNSWPTRHDNRNVDDISSEFSLFLRDSLFEKSRTFSTNE